MGARSSLKPGDILAGTYRIERLVGSGGTAAVFAAVHVKLGSLAAIKVLLPRAAARDDIVERFAREGRAVARIKSRHVAHVLDVDKLEDGTPYLVMEYLQGRDLRQLLDDTGALPIPAAVEYVLQACEGVAEAHKVGIVHRDLKPANLFLAKRPKGDIIKVLDFGVAKTFAASEDFELTRVGDVVGSPHFVAPEQISTSREIDARADIWAFGVVLYRLISNAPPFEGATFAELCLSIQEAIPPSLRARRPEVPKALERVIFKCLAKDPSDRHATIGDLTRALRGAGQATS